MAHESLTNTRALYNLLWRMVLRNSEDVLNGPGWVGFMSSVGSGERPGMLVRTPRGAGQPSKVTAASKLRGSVHLTGLIYGIQPVEGPRGLGCSSLGSFSCCCRSPTCLSAEAGGGEWAGLDGGPEASWLRGGTGLGQSQAGGGARGPAWKARLPGPPTVSEDPARGRGVGHIPSYPPAAPAQRAAGGSCSQRGPGRLSAPAALPKCSRRLLPATCTFLLKRQKNLPDLRIVFTLHTFIALFTFRSSL